MLVFTMYITFYTTTVFGALSSLTIFTSQRQKYVRIEDSETCLRWEKMKQGKQRDGEDETREAKGWER